MSRSRNSRKGSRKGHWWKRGNCSCFLCVDPKTKMAILGARADERSRKS